jgi:hypothetical protein
MRSVLFIIAWMVCRSIGAYGDFLKEYSFSVTALLLVFLILDIADIVSRRRT